MTEALCDTELLAEYAEASSEAAFRALVARHVDLVYATALRQVGDPGIAEEVAQNVFIALARKAPRLSGTRTLAGWLHRTALLESKARIRSELRRRRREEIAVEINRVECEGQSPFAALVPILDEALLNLREIDRLALVLRYLEQRSLRDVGNALGIEEEAARKRVSRAVDRLSEFFRCRGFSVQSGAAIVMLMSQAVQGAPPGLAVAAAHAAMATAPALGINTIVIQLMALSKPQTAAVCILLAAAPLLYQWRSEARLAQAHTDLTAQVEQARQQADLFEARLRNRRQEIDSVRAQTIEFEDRLATLAKIGRDAVPHPVYEWNDQSPLIRVPKQIARELPITGIRGHQGKLTEEVKEVLQLSNAESDLVQAAIDRFLSYYHTAQARNSRAVEPTEYERNGRPSDEVRAFDVTYIGPLYDELRQRLFDEVERVIGPERFEIFRSAIDDWMPVDDEGRGINSNMAVFNYDHRVFFYRPNPGDRRLTWGIRGNQSSMSHSIPLEEIPSPYRLPLADWIARAQSQPPTPD